MSTETAIDDGFTDAERQYFQSRGDVSEALVKEAEAPPSPAPDVPVVPDAPPLVPETRAALPDEPDEVEEPAAVAPEGKKPRRVPYSQYETELKARQDLERKMQEDAVQRARIEERLSLLQQALQEPQHQDQTPQAPDPEQDIFGYVRYQNDRLNSALEKIATYEQQLTAGQAAMEEQQRYISSINNFAAREPHAIEAYNYLMANRSLELLSHRHPNANVEQLVEHWQKNGLPNDIRQAIQEEERSLYQSAFEAGRDPAQDIFRLAHVRGFRPPTAQQPQTNGAAAAPSSPQPPAAVAPSIPPRPGTPLGSVPGATAASPPMSTPSAADVVASIQNGQRAARSLSQVGGGSIEAQMTPEMLAGMTDEQFADLYNELTARGDKSRLMQLFGQ